MGCIKMSKTFRDVILENFNNGNALLGANVHLYDLTQVYDSNDELMKPVIMIPKIDRPTEKLYGDEADLAHAGYYEALDDYVDPDDFEDQEIIVDKNIDQILAHIGKYGVKPFRPVNTIMEFDPYDDEVFYTKTKRSKDYARSIITNMFGDEFDSDIVFVYGNPDQDVIIRDVGWYFEDKFAPFSHRAILEIHGAMAHYLGISCFMLVLKRPNSDDAFLNFAKKIIDDIAAVDVGFNEYQPLNPIYPFVEMVRRYGSLYIGTPRVNQDQFIVTLNHIKSYNIAEIPHEPLGRYFRRLKKLGIDPKTSALQAHVNDDNGNRLNAYVPKMSKMIEEVRRSLYSILGFIGDFDLSAHEIKRCLIALDNDLVNYLIVYPEDLADSKLEKYFDLDLDDDMDMNDDDNFGDEL